MKQKNIKHLLLNSLLDIDFLITKKNAKNNYLQASLNFGKKKISILNPLSTYTSIKQLIRVIQFFKKQSNPFINFFVKEAHQKSLIMSFIKQNNSFINYKIFYKFLILKKQKDAFQFTFAIDRVLNNAKIIENVFMRENIFLAQEINSVSQKLNNGIYRLNNNLFDYKKLFFILLILKQICSK